MLSGESVAAPLADLPADLAEVGVYGSFAEGSERGLVVLAMGEAYWLVPGETGFRLFVEPHIAPMVREQLARFDRERLRWPPAPIVDPAIARRFEIVVPLLGSLALLVIFVLQSTRPAWTDLGVLDAAALFERGEWWRPLTALFLHGSGDHVIANALLGLLVSCAVLTTFGRARGVLLAFVASILANVASAALHYPADYRSLGASTAIFAGVGLLTGRAGRLVARSDHPHRWRLLFVPFAAGLTVLGLYGAGGVAASVDVGAHVAGFISGLVFGFILNGQRGGMTAGAAAKI
jgi:rhomboid protease GluP